jgi:hypothetical protein
MVSSSTYESDIIGHFSVSSLAETDLGLDWALIELLDQSVYKERHDQNANYRQITNGLPRQTLPCPKETTSVLAATGYSGRMSGVLLPGSTMMRLSPGGKFQEVWTVQFGKTLGKKFAEAPTMS